MRTLFGSRWSKANSTIWETMTLTFLLDQRRWLVSKTPTSHRKPMLRSTKPLMPMSRTKTFDPSTHHQLLQPLRRTTQEARMAATAPTTLSAVLWRASHPLLQRRLLPSPIVCRPTTAYDQASIAHVCLWTACVLVSSKATTLPRPPCWHDSSRPTAVTVSKATGTATRAVPPIHNRQSWAGYAMRSAERQ